MNLAEKELFNEKVKGIYAAIDANADVQNNHFINLNEKLDEKLDRIEKQVTLTNSRVNHLEDKELTHVIDCPITNEVTKIKEDLAEYRIAKKYPKIFITGVVVYGVLLVFGLLCQFGLL